MVFEEFKRQISEITPLNGAQVALNIGANVTDGFLRGLLESGIGNLSSPVLSGVWGIPTLLMLATEKGKTFAEKHPVLQNFFAFNTASEFGEMTSWISSPQARVLGEKIFPADLIAKTEGKIKSLLSQAKAKITNIIPQNEGSILSGIVNIQQRQNIIPERPTVLRKKRRVLGATRG